MFILWWYVCDDVINPQTNKIYETCENHRGLPKEIKEQIKEEEDKIKEDINRKLYEHFKNKPVNNVLNATIVKTYPELLEWLDDDKIW